MQSRRGFTLIEIMIVLVIAALIVGGVFSAVTLKRASELQSMISEYDTYIKAIGEFQDKYQALPGDMGGTDGSGYTPHDMWKDNAGAAAIDGDGNGHIGSSTTDAFYNNDRSKPANGNLTNTYEWYNAWVHLVSAGFLSGSYSNVAAAATMTAKAGGNVPSSAVGGAGWTLMYALYPNKPGNDNTSSLLWMDNYGHIFAFGAASQAGHQYTDGPILTASDAASVDVKMDDGNPGTGTIRAWRTNINPNPGCVASDTSQTNMAYVVSSKTYVCSLIFLTGF